MSIPALEAHTRPGKGCVDEMMEFMDNYNDNSQLQPVSACFCGCAWLKNVPMSKRWLRFEVWLEGGSFGTSTDLRLSRQIGEGTLQGTGCGVVGWCLDGSALCKKRLGGEPKWKSPKSPWKFITFQRYIICKNLQNLQK